MYRSIRSLKNPRAFRTWLYRIARNAATDQLRGSPRERSLEDPAVRQTIVAASREEIGPDFDDVDVADLHAGLARIDPIHREALTLAFLEDFSYEEIAGIVGIPIGTVRSGIHNGRRVLRRAIEAIREQRETGPRKKGGA